VGLAVCGWWLLISGRRDNAGHHLPAQSQRESIPEGIVNLRWRVTCMAVLVRILGKYRGTKIPICKRADNGCCNV